VRIREHHVAGCAVGQKDSTQNAMGLLHDLLLGAGGHARYR